VIVEAEFATEWKGGLPPDPSQWYRFGGDRTQAEATFLSDDDRTTMVSFGASDVGIVSLPEGYVRMSLRCEAKQGSGIFGQIPEHFRELKRFVFLAYGLQKEYSDSHRVRFRTIRMRFFVNGIEHFSAHLDVNKELVVEGEPIVTIPKSLPIEFSAP
jgi:hypothetical protein